jgi:hypothetical protein
MRSTLPTSDLDLARPGLPDGGESRSVPVLQVDGVTNDTKRKRGQHGPRKNKLPPKRPKRSTNTYEEGHLFESPLHPVKSVKKAKYPSKAPPLPPPPSFSMVANPSDLFKAFGMEERTASFYSHVAPVERRADPSAWAGTLDPSMKAVVNAAMDLTKEVCMTLCGGDELAGLALWEKVRKPRVGIFDDESTVGKSVIQTIAECYVNAPKSSVEMRVLRSCLCVLSRGNELSALRQSIPGLTLSADAFAQGRRDLERLRNGVLLHCEPRTVRRATTETMDRVI